MRPRAAKFAIDGDRQARLVTGTSSDVSIEQYRKVAATLHEEQVRSQLKTVIVTSALPGEGKTLTVVNLALTLSESYGRRVLVIDADLRGPSLHTALEHCQRPRPLRSAGRRPQLTFVQVSNDFAVLPAGTPGPTPLAALTSDRMARGPRGVRGTVRLGADRYAADRRATRCAGAGAPGRRRALRGRRRYDARGNGRTSHRRVGWPRRDLRSACSIGSTSGEYLPPATTGTISAIFRVIALYCGRVAAVCTSSIPCHRSSVNQQALHPPERANDT